MIPISVAPSTASASITNPSEPANALGATATLNSINAASMENEVVFVRFTNIYEMLSILKHIDKNYRIKMSAAYSPLKTGDRFSIKADNPSLVS